MPARRSSSSAMLSRAFIHSVRTGSTTSNNLSLPRPWLEEKLTPATQQRMNDNPPPQGRRVVVTVKGKVVEQP